MFQSFSVTIIMHKERDPLELEAIRTGIKDMSFLLGILIMIIPNSNYRAFSYLNGQLCDRSTLSKIIRRNSLSREEQTAESPDAG